MTEPVFLLAILLVGLLAGAASGLLGIGGGIVMVPALVFLAGLDFRSAVAVSLLVMVVATPWGVRRHHRAGHVHPRTGLILGLSGFAGVLAATAVGPLLSEAHLMVLFAVVLVASAQRLAYGRLPQRHVAAVAPLLLFGFVAGLVAKLLGVGGGIIMVPGLVFLGHGMHVAVGTSLVAVWTNAVLSTGINVFADHTGWLLAVPLAIGSVAGVQLGAVGALRSRADPLRRLFALLMLATALGLVLRSLG